MYDDHPYSCKRLAYPTKCKRCGDEVIYWECWHNSKVFFDPPDLGRHDCSTGSPLPASAWSLSYLPPEPGMRLGLKRFPPDIARWIGIARSGQSELQQRNTVSVTPADGERRNVAGDISAVSRVDLRKKFKLEERILLASHLAQRFPGLQVTQITLLVDDLINDPAANDILSFTMWYPEGLAPSDLALHESVRITLVAVKLLVGDIWIGESIERPEGDIA